jgi:hypothetical protein
MAALLERLIVATAISYRAALLEITLLSDSPRISYGRGAARSMNPDNAAHNVRSVSDSSTPQGFAPAHPEAPSRGKAARQPRLGVAHLLIWTAGSAAILAVQRATGMWEQAEGAFFWFMVAMAVPQCLIYGALLGSTAVGISRRVRGAIFPVHPGQ